MNKALRQKLRQVEGRNSQPSAALSASLYSFRYRRQSVGENDGKQGEVYGFDGGKLSWGAIDA